MRARPKWCKDWPPGEAVEAWQSQQTDVWVWATRVLVRDPRPDHGCWRRCSETHLARGLTSMIMTPAQPAPPLRWDGRGETPLPKADAHFTAEN